MYFNQENLMPLYDDIKAKLFSHTEYKWEVVMVDDGSRDKSWQIMEDLARKDERIKIYKLSRNFGSHAAILCGMSKATGDCSVIKAADLQEPTEMILDMVASWKKGNNVVLAVRADREEGLWQKLFANFYYSMMRKVALPTMPKGGFDVFLLDKRVIKVIELMDEKNSAITGQILWSGFKTEQIYYTRKAREIGKSRWTLKKKIKLVADTLFSFSTVPIIAVSVIGAISFIGSILWSILVLVLKLTGNIAVTGWTTLFI
ncbi:MAG: glycosyltransferase family 2 protein, partial [Oscillospiraceae bacterium]